MHSIMHTNVLISFNFRGLWAELKNPFSSSRFGGIEHSSSFSYEWDINEHRRPSALTPKVRHPARRAQIQAQSLKPARQTYSNSRPHNT